MVNPPLKGVYTPLFGRKPLHDGEMTHTPKLTYFDHAAYEAIRGLN